MGLRRRVPANDFPVKIRRHVCSPNNCLHASHLRFLHMNFLFFFFFIVPLLFRNRSYLGKIPHVLNVNITKNQRTLTATNCNILVRINYNLWRPLCVRNVSHRQFLFIVCCTIYYRRQRGSSTLCFYNFKKCI